MGHNGHLPSTRRPFFIQRLQVNPVDCRVKPKIPVLALGFTDWSVGDNGIKISRPRFFREGFCDSSGGCEGGDIDVVRHADKQLIPPTSGSAAGRSTPSRTTGTWLANCEISSYASFDFLTIHTDFVIPGNNNPSLTSRLNTRTLLL